MRIGIDGRELRGQPTGVGRCLTNLCRQWRAAPAAAGVELVIYAPGPVDPPGGTGSAPGAALTLTEVPGGGGAWWEQVRLARHAAADRLDVFFGPGYSAPLALRAPSVVTLHDLSFEAHPEWFGPREGLRRRWLARRSAAAARAIVTVSACSKQEIVEHYAVDPARVHVIPNGVAAPDTPVAGTAGAPAPDADSGPLILYAGARFTRRNLPTLIETFARVIDRIPAARLVIAGPDRTHPPQDLRGVADAAGVGDRVTFLDYLDDGELATLYRRATLFAWFSEYEGFGLTPLEALAAGVPAVVGDIPVAREVYGEAVRYVPLGTPDDAAAAMIELLTDRAARDALLAHGAPTLARYTWARAATDTLAVLEAAAAEAPR